jgi:hypothetical protein
MTRPPYRYSVYGIEVLSDTPLALTPCTGGGLATVAFRSAAEPDFLTAVETADFDSRSESWYRYAWLPDGSAYVRWEAVGEFLVAANGGCIRWRRFDESSIESFQVYLLGQALSFALVKQRLEPLHATVVTVDDRAVAFLGNSGAGKSTLAACFLEAGHRLVTDDLLLLHEESGRLLAYPGPPRLKLFPEIAGRFFPQIADGVAMNVDTEKLILGLDARLKETAPVALAAIYSLTTPDDDSATEGVHVEEFSRREAFFELVKSTFNRHLVSAERLARQFDAATRLSDLVPIARLRYPRSLDRLAEARESIYNHLRNAGVSRPSDDRAGSQWAAALEARHS